MNSVYNFNFVVLFGKTPLSTIFQLYRGGQNPEKTTDLWQVTESYHINVLNRSIFTKFCTESVSEILSGLVIKTLN
jgi:hypothetical protein